MFSPCRAGQVAASQENKDMPLGNMSNMTEEERKTLGIWIENYRAAKGH